MKAFIVGAVALCLLVPALCRGDEGHGQDTLYLDLVTYAADGQRLIGESYVLFQGDVPLAADHATLTSTALDKTGNLFYAIYYPTGMQDGRYIYQHEIRRIDNSGNQTILAQPDAFGDANSSLSLGVGWEGSPVCVGGLVCSSTDPPVCDRVRVECFGKWSAEYSAPDALTSMSMMLDATGVVYVVTIVDGVLVLLKYQPTGEEQWRVTHDFGETLNAVVGATITAGGDVTLGGDVNGKIGLVKFDGDGGEVWSVLEPPALDGQRLAPAVMLPDNFTDGVIVVSTLEDGASRHIVVHKFDPDGNLLWDYRYEPETSVAGGQCLAVGGFEDDSVCVAGRAGENDVVFKLDVNGVWLWSADWPGGPAPDRVSITTDLNGAVTTVNNATGGGRDAGVIGMRVAKIDVDGNPLWNDFYLPPNTTQTSVIGLERTAQGDLMAMGVHDLFADDDTTVDDDTANADDDTTVDDDVTADDDSSAASDDNAHDCCGC